MAVGSCQSPHGDLRVYKVMIMLRTRIAALVVALGAGAVMFLPLPAQAQHVAVVDPVGDTDHGGLDIIGARVNNEERAIVVRVDFDRVKRGDLTVSVQTRRGPGVRIVSLRRPVRGDKTFLLGGSFKREQLRACRRVTGIWSKGLDTARLRLPASCLQSGNYGAVRVAILTESAHGDEDLAPDPRGHTSHTPWIPRG
jgi:hypothetical protein